MGDCFEVARLICDEFKTGEYSTVGLVYTEFVSMLSQEPHFVPVLPLSELTDEEETEPVRNLILYEPESTEEE